ncbi:MAG TPA: ThuA domain-containing protein [Gemmataceae bacterium]|nr:ThuA domain-containing protein [Gemmataceae bacterium]
MTKRVVRSNAISDDNGVANLAVNFADSITAWRLSASANSRGGALGGVTVPLKVFQDFFVDIDLPVTLTQNDEVAFPVAVYNYLKTPQSVKIELQAEPWFSLLDEGGLSRTLNLKPEEVRSVRFRIKANKIGWQPLTVNARGSKQSDAVKRVVEVVPDGTQVERVVTDRLSGRVQQTIEIPQHAIADASKLLVKLYPGILAQVMEGMEGTMRMPGGCMEQTSSSAYPNVLVVDYIKKAKIASPQMLLKAEQYLNVGYQKLLTFERPGGGFDWWGNGPPLVWLSAYGLMEFADMAKVYPVDKGVIDRTQAYLLQQMDKDGTWSNIGATHSETIASMGNAKMLLTSYVSWALLESGLPKAQLQKSIDYIRGHVNDAGENAYVLALAANALAAFDAKDDSTLHLLQRLDALRKEVPEWKAANFPAKATSITYARGDSVTIETTALTAMAMARTGQFTTSVNKSLTYLIKAKQGNGTWGSTSATILSLKALLAGMAGTPHKGDGLQAAPKQLPAPRITLPVVGVQVTSDRRTLILTTAPHPELASYALTLPVPRRTTLPKGKQPGLPQVLETDLSYDLCGALASWHAQKGDDSWTGWLPHLDLGVARKLTVASALHDELWSSVKEPGQLTLRTKLTLFDRLRRAVQPGVKMDSAWPAEEVAVELISSVALEVRSPGSIVSRTKDNQGRHITTVRVRPAQGSPIPVEIKMPTGGNAPGLSVSYYTKEDPRRRSLPRQRFLLPWATLKKDSTATTQRDIPELRGGNWERGRRVFFSDLGTCSRCHRVGGQGGTIGPDLSNLWQRDYASVLRDIAEPSFALHPDYITHVLTLKDGRVLTGNVRTEKDLLHISDEQGTITTLRRDQIGRLETSPLSLMPGELPKQIGSEKMKDLLTFLLTEPPRMPDYGKGQPPPPRSIQEVIAVFAGAPDPPLKTRPIHIILVPGKQDHGPGEHDYPAWLSVWQRLLSMAEEVKVSTAQEWPTTGEFKTADVMVFYQRGKWTPERARDIEAYLARGGGLVYIHRAIDGGDNAPGFAQRIGLAWRSGTSQFRRGAVELNFEGGNRHPIARNFTKVTLRDESYWELVGDAKKVNVLAVGVEGGKARPLVWTLEPVRGRVFVSIPGHFAWTFDDPLYRVLLLRGIAWVARAPVDRFNPLVTPGARIKP